MAQNIPRRHDLWYLIGGPTIWAIHFLTSYVGAAVFCAKASSPDVSLAGLRIFIAILTALALAGVAYAGAAAFRRGELAEAADPPYDENSLEGRHRFLGFATLLLCGLSAVAILYGALPAFLMPDCR